MLGNPLDLPHERRRLLIIQAHGSEHLERLKIYRVQIVSLPDATMIGLQNTIQFELDKRLMMSLSTAQVEWCKSLKDLVVREK